MTISHSDEIRELILNVLYSSCKKARSIRGIGVKSSELKKTLKQKGLKEQDIVSNLHYLLQAGWVIEEREKFTMSRGGKTIEAERKFYKISDKGINHFEGPSKFQGVYKFEGINVTNIQGITVIGDGNYVYTQYADLYRNLDLLGEEIRRNDQLSDEQKLNYQAEINTIKSQLSKQNPDRSILKRAWQVLKSIATIGSLITIFEKVRMLIEPLLI